MCPVLRPGLEPAAPTILETPPNRPIGLSRAKSPPFGRFSWHRVEDYVIQNQVVNRSAMEMLGYMPANVIISRNNFERIEKFMDSGTLLLFGFMLPSFLLKPLTRWYTGRFLTHPFRLPAKANPLMTPFQDLDANRLRSAAHQLKLARQWGLRSTAKVPALSRQVLNGKLLVLLVDLVALALQGQLYVWGKNFVTEQLSGRTGFSGEFNQASKSQVEQNTQHYQANKKRYQALSWAILGTEILALPLLMRTLLRNPRIRAGQGTLGKLKGLSKHFNYFDTVFMSKWLYVYSTFFHWGLAGSLAARDKHERREHWSKFATVEFFYSIGDDLIAGLAAMAFHRSAKYKNALKGVKLYKTGWFGLPFAKSLPELKAATRHIKSPQTKAVVDQLGRVNFRIGLLTTIGLLGIGVTAINNWVTHQKLLAEQAALKQATYRRLILPPSYSSALN